MIRHADRAGTLIIHVDYWVTRVSCMKVKPLHGGEDDIVAVAILEEACIAGARDSTVPPFRDAA